MKNLDISQVFCEILGGLGAVFLAVGLLDLFGITGVGDATRWVVDKLSLVLLTTLLVLTYLIGLLVDAAGLVFDKLIIDRWKLLKRQPIVSDKVFFRSAPAHIFADWKEQWTYFSCYRNLFMLSVPGVVVWPLVVCRYAGWLVGLGVALGSVAVSLVLWMAMGELLTVYDRRVAKFQDQSC